MNSYEQYVGQDVVIVEELLEDVEAGKPYEPGFAPPWNYIGNVLHIISYDAEDKFFKFIDQDGRKEEMLMTYDFDHGFVVPMQEEIEDQVESDIVIGLL